MMNIDVESSEGRSNN